MHYLVLLVALIGKLNGEQPQQQPIIHITPEQLIEISDQLLLEDIAEVDLDPEAFDVPAVKRKLKKDPLDDIEFM